jgi:hypothetical protein
MSLSGDSVGPGESLGFASSEDALQKTLHIAILLGREISRIDQSFSLKAKLCRDKDLDQVFYYKLLQIPFRPVSPGDYSADMFIDLPDLDVRIALMQIVG